MYANSKTQYGIKSHRQMSRTRNSDLPRKAYENLNRRARRWNARAEITFLRELTARWFRSFLRPRGGRFLELDARGHGGAQLLRNQLRIAPARHEFRPLWRGKGVSAISRVPVLIPRPFYACRGTGCLKNIGRNFCREFCVSTHGGTIM